MRSVPARDDVVYWRCVSEVAGHGKYPRLPVTECAGYEEEPGESAVRRFSKGEEIESVILSVDPERERISLGIKQLDDDPFTDYTAVNDRGSIVKGVIREVEPKEAVLELAEDVLGVLKASEISIDRVEDARAVS